MSYVKFNGLGHRSDLLILRENLICVELRKLSVLMAAWPVLSVSVDEFTAGMYPVVVVTRVVTETTRRSGMCLGGRPGDVDVPGWLS